MFARPSKQKVVLYTFLTLTLVGGCDCDDDDPNDEVVVRIEPGVDFTEFETFAIKNDLTDDELEDAGIDPDKIPGEVKLNIGYANDQAREELLERGLTEVDDDEDPDLVVVSLGSTQDEDAIYWECVPGYWWGYWGYVWDNCAWLEPIYVSYTVGTMALALADPAEEEVVFGGLLQGVADGSNDAEDRIRDGVSEMFEQYPVEPSP